MNRSGKEAFREKLLECLPKDKPISYRGLQGIDLVFEKKILEMGLEIRHLELFETDATNYLFIREKLKACFDKEVYSFVYKDIDKASTKDIENIDLLWYDYCGPVTSQRIETMDAICYSLSEDQVYAVTFMVGRERSFSGLVEEVLEEEQAKEILATEDPLLKRIQFLYLALKQDVNRPHLRIDAYTYQDTVPMISLVIKRSTKTSLTIKALDRELVFEDDEQSSLGNLSVEADRNLMQRIEKALEKGSFKRADVWDLDLMGERTFARKMKDLTENKFLISHGEKRGRFYTKGAAWKTL